jgi:predicted dehydrogenase
MSRRRTALLGFGHVAEHGHLPAWRARDDFAVVAVAEPDPVRRAAAARLLPGARLYADPLDALRAESLDAVDIAAPPMLHVPLAIAAARAGCHVLCEKPLATMLGDYRALRDAVQRAGVVLCTVHNWKYSDQFTRLAAFVSEGAIGRPTRVRFETIRTGRAVSVGSEWRGNAAQAGGGILVDHGWHALYLLLGLANEPAQQIRATLERRRYTTADVEDTATCQLDFRSLCGEIFLTWAGDTRRTCWSVEGTDGLLELTDDRGELVRRDARQQFVFPRSLSAGSHHPDWFTAVIDDFVGEISDPALRGRNLAEAERCLLLTALAYQSGSEGGRTLAVPAGVATESALA